MRLEIIGNIASGKTTLAQSLASSVEVVFEDSAANPFLKSFYQAPDRFSFETEITFTLQHYHEIKKKLNLDIVCDFSLLLDLSYADVTLSDNKRRLYVEMFNELEVEVGRPDVLIYLRCPEEVLMERIHDRGRDFEKDISIQYLQAMRKSIQANVQKVPRSTKIFEIDSHRIDFAHNESSVTEVKESILGLIK